MGEPCATKVVKLKGEKEIVHMSNEKKTLSNQSLPERKATHERAVKKLGMALKITGIAFKIISIVERLIGWLG